MPAPLRSNLASRFSLPLAEYYCWANRLPCVISSPPSRSWAESRSSCWKRIARSRFSEASNLHDTQTRRSFWKSRSAIMKKDKDNIELSAVEDHDGMLTIRGGGARRDWNGIHYKQGMSAKNVGTTSLSANVATIPPGGVAYAHIHVGFEVILYILEGKVRHEFGPRAQADVGEDAVRGRRWID